MLSFNWLTNLLTGRSTSGDLRRRRQGIPDRIQKYYLPRSVLEQTGEVMRRFGREERECYVWWGGYFTERGEGQILSAIWPEIATDFGRVHLDNPSLSRLHSKLRSLDQILLVELHTHPPGAGGQNQVDAAHPAATYKGFLSVVVPDFGFPTLSGLQDSYVYEYRGSGAWKELTKREKAQMFQIEETGIAVQ